MDQFAADHKTLTELCYIMTGLCVVSSICCVIAGVYLYIQIRREETEIAE